jgi:predicted  nucleic acid-binding Zn-ribbon protein
VNLAQHLEKTEDKLTKSKERLSKLEDQIGSAGYKDKVDFEVKQADEKRMGDLKSEVQTFHDLLESMRKLILQE